MSARSDLAATIGAGFPGTVKVIDDTRSIGELDPKLTGVVQLFRVTTSPAPTQGRYVLEFELWVLSPLKAPELVEDDLDDALDVVLEQLSTIPNLLWSKAERAIHADGYHGHKIALTITGTTKE